MTASHNVSIIIPHFKRIDELKRLLISLKTITEPNEIIIIESKNPAKARNEGVTRAKGEFIWFLDSDSEIQDPEVLNRMVEILKDDSIAGVGGELVEVNGMWHALVPFHFPNWFSFSRYFNKPFEVYPRCIATNNLLIRKKDFIGFDEDLKTMEDNDLCLRMKGKFIARQDTCVLHHHSLTERKVGKFAFYNDTKNYINTIHQTRVEILYRNRRHLLWILPLLDIIFAPPTLLYQMLSNINSNILLAEKSGNKIGLLWFIILHIKSMVSSWKKGYELLVNSN